MSGSIYRLYDYECQKCGYQVEHLTAKGDTFTCPVDGEVLKQMPPVFRINMGPVPVTGHYDDNLQTFIRSNSHRKEVMLEQGVTEKGATPKQGQAWV